LTHEKQTRLLFLFGCGQEIFSTHFLQKGLFRFWPWRCHEGCKRTLEFQSGGLPSTSQRTPVHVLGGFDSGLVCVLVGGANVPLLHEEGAPRQKLTLIRSPTELSQGVSCIARKQTLSMFGIETQCGDAVVLGKNFLPLASKREVFFACCVKNREVTFGMVFLKGVDVREQGICTSRDRFPSARPCSLFRRQRHF
jgi:hypothetical protein